MIELTIYTAMSGILAMALVWFFMFEYRYYRIRVLRHHLFAARDALFTAAARGDLSFNDRAYGMARTVINGLLRKAEALSLPYVLTLEAMMPRADKDHRLDEFDTRFSKANEKLTETGKAAVARAMNAVHFYVVSHVLHISVVWFIPVQLYKLKLWVSNRLGSFSVREDLKFQIERVEDHYKERLRDLDRQAFAVGESVELENQAYALAA